MKKETTIQQRGIFKKTKENLWNALTNIDHMRQCILKKLTFLNPKQVAKYSFQFSIKKKNFTHRYNVYEVILNEKIVYRWLYEEYDGDSTVSF